MIDYLIAGSGIIGSALSYELSQRNAGTVAVLDPDLSGTLSATERNAGGVRHLWQHEINFELSRHSISLFEKIKAEIGFQQKGYLWLCNENNYKNVKQVIEDIKKRGVEYLELTPHEIKKRYPFLDKLSDVPMAVLGPKDGILNSNSLKNYYQNKAKERGVHFHNLSAITSFNESSSEVEVFVKKMASQTDAETFLKTPHRALEYDETLRAKNIIFCCDAWTKLISHLDLEKLMTPLRRMICVFKADNFDMASYGMVVDNSGVYFHAEGGNVLSGYVTSDEKPGFNFEYDDSFFETHIWPTLYERVSLFERLKFITGWAGLYSYTPDKSGILGKVPGLTRVFESHSFTGRGVMQSYGAAIAMADLLTEGKFKTIDASVLSRERFSTKQLLIENLHI